MKNKITILFLFIGLLFNACNKDDDDDDNNEKSRTYLLSSGVWKLTGMKVDPAIAGVDANGSPVFVSDLYSTQPDCFKDDILKFNSDKNYTHDLKTKCAGESAQIISGTWGLNDDESIITMDNTRDYTILSLSESQFVCSETDGQYTYTYTYVH